MASSGNDGPDGSSIKPVSSLRARFENMSKPGSDSLATIPSPSPIARSISPAPKPDRLRDQPPTPTGAHRPPVAPKPKPLQPLTPTSSSLLLGSATSAPTGSGVFLRPSNRTGPPPPVSPRPIAPPSLLVQPPLSPPKGRATNTFSVSEASSFLNPDAVAKTPLSPSPSPRRTPSRPHSPNTLEARRSPRLSSSQPPSPPPPRRSAELKRERDLREFRDPDRDHVHDHVHASLLRVGHEKPNVPPQHFSGGKTIADSRSPFNSPPDSDEEQPPSLPARPRPQLHTVDRTTSMPPPPRAKPAAAPLMFDPPPVHHSLVSRRMDRDREQEAAAIGNGSTPEMRPPLPSRPQTTAELPPRNHIHSGSMAPPPRRPPRAAYANGSSSSNGRNGNGGFGHGNSNSSSVSISTSNSNSNSNSTSTSTAMLPPPQKRVVSNPVASTPTYLPPSSRAQHGRSMTVDTRAGSRTASELRPQSMALTIVEPSTPVIGLTKSASVSGRSGGGGGGGGGMGGLGGLGGPGVDHISPAKVAESAAATFPDPSNINRRPPYIKQGVPEINTQYACRVLDVCGQLVCTTGHFTRVWSLLDGELLMSLAHGENVKATAVAFRPGAHVDDEGLRVWIGNGNGELMEADIATQSIVASKPQAHSRHEVIKIYRHFNELWTLDDSGGLLVWGPDEESNVPSLAGSPDQTYRLPRAHSFSMVVGDELWHATGKELRVFEPSLDGTSQFQVLMRALCLDGAGDISAGATLVSDEDKVYFGHTDGKVSIYSRRDYTCVGVLSLGSYKINSMASAGTYIWAGYTTGRVCVYDTGCTPWAIKKDWAAHDQPVMNLLADRSSAYRAGQVQMVTLGADSMLRVWEGLLQDDWLEAQMQGRDTTYCSFDTIRVQVLTWNAGASTPNSLRYADDDATFMQSYLQSSGSPDILVFGFQELVDLEDKTATAKRFLKPKKKEGSDQERMSHQYRDWRDFLVRSLDDFMAGELYHLLQTAHMVGLFTCIFVKADLRDRIRSVGMTEVKRGMGGLHGNKGAIAVRFLVDDTSLCFVNCHLAAGQSQAAHRHNDIAAILESSALPAERDATARIDRFVGGGDGSMMLDHELCVLNGDLNYRIDTMSRDAVVAAVKAGNLAKLLERDQLLVARRRNAAFRLRAFEELPIGFAPTYKYDVGTDNYDSSEKKRSPAWCDRLLFRGGQAGRVQQLDYRRHEVRVSDHRPVTGRFAFTVKRIDAKRRAVAWMECQQSMEDRKAAMMEEENMYYLTHIIGYDTATSQGLIRDRTSRR